MWLTTRNNKHAVINIFFIFIEFINYLQQSFFQIKIALNSLINIFFILSTQILVF